MDKIKVLIVDDHKVIRDGLKAMLKDNELTEIVSVANSCAEALDILERRTEIIDVILMDISMPDMDGIEGAKMILGQFSGAKIIALTMHNDELTISKMIDAGALGYLLKDSEIDEIVKAIVTVFKGQKYFSNEVSVALINSMMNKEKPKLSAREIEVLQSVSRGYSNKRIGENLFISTRTVETHRRNILEKLDLNNTIEMVKYAIEQNLI